MKGPMNKGKKGLSMMSPMNKTMRKMMTKMESGRKPTKSKKKR